MSPEDKKKSETTEPEPAQEKESCENNEDRGAESLKPGPKVGESPDNLKQRSDWFQKRRGNAK